MCDHYNIFNDQVILEVAKTWLSLQEKAELRTDGHYDVHGLTKDHLDFIASHPEVLAAKGPVQLTLPEHLPEVPSSLKGPAAGHEPVGEQEVHYADRGGGRNIKSRMIHGEHGGTRTVTAIARPNPQTGKPFLITAFGGPLAPKEVDDPTHTPESKEEAKKFWSQHALLTGKAKE